MSGEMNRGDLVEIARFEGFLTDNSQLVQAWLEELWLNRDLIELEQISGNFVHKLKIVHEEFLRTENLKHIFLLFNIVRL